MLVTLARPFASRALLPQTWSSIHALCIQRACNSTLSGSGVSPGISDGTLNPWQEDSDEPLTPFPAGISMSDDPTLFPEHLYSSSLVHGRASLPAPRHPITHGIPSATLHLRSYHLQPLTRFTGVAYHAAAALGIPLSNVAMLPTQRTLWTVPKSPFVHKGAQENFERRTHKRAIKAWDTHPDIVERWIRFLMQHSEGGVGMRVVRWERAPVGVGARALESVQKRMEEGKRTKEKIEKLGGKIVEREMEALAKEAKA